jgi:hypothetical protein
MHAYTHSHTHALLPVQRTGMSYFKISYWQAISVYQQCYATLNGNIGFCGRLLTLGPSPRTGHSRVCLTAGGSRIVLKSFFRNVLRNRGPRPRCTPHCQKQGVHEHCNLGVSQINMMHLQTIAVRMSIHLPIFLTVPEDAGS